MTETPLPKPAPPADALWTGANGAQSWRSIRTMVSLLVLLPIVTISVILLLLSVYTSGKIESRLSSHLVHSTSSMVRYKVLDSLRDARWISDLYLFRINNGIVPESPAPAWERLMFASINTRPTLSSICFATPEGRGIAVMRIGDSVRLARYNGTGPGTTQLLAVDSRGDAIQPALRTYDYDVTTRPWFQLAMSNDEPAWTPVYAWSTGKPDQPILKPVTSVGYVRKVKKADGTLLGVLSVDVSLEMVTELLAESDLAKRGTLLVLDAQSQILSAAGRVKNAHRALESIVDSHADDVAALRTAMAEADDPSNLENHLNGRYISVAPIRPFPGIDWRLAAIVPQNAVNTETTALQRNMAIAGVACTAVALAMGAVLARRIILPIQSIANTVRRIGCGDFDAPIEPQKTLELAQLSAAINDMKRQLHEQVELRARNDALEQAADAKTAFFNRVTHELRTPLNAIIGYAELLEEQDHVRRDETSREDLRRILQASRQLLHLINDVLDLARTEAGRMDVRMVDVDIVQLLREVEETARPLCQRNRNAFGVFTEQVEGMKLRTDPQKLKQILLNLLSNAAKFTHDGEIVLRVTRDNAHVCFSIRDTGGGIDTDKIPQMFEPFTQGDMTAEGSGLGLSITRQFTRLLGGEIEMSSNRGVGTTVEVIFPVDAASIVRRAGEAAGSVRGPL